MTKRACSRYTGYRLPSAIISHAVWLYFRLTVPPSLHSDFETYRYLAGQGFLPGYNFPRLPLMAFIPARRGTVGRDSFLSRPRFLGLSEFGPQSIIYHEGSTYRVRKALLGIRDEEAVTTSLLAAGAQRPPVPGLWLRPLQ